MKNFFLILFLFVPALFFAQSGGGIKGVISTGCINRGQTGCLPLDSVHVKIYSPAISDTLYALTDSTGKFFVKPLPAGVYYILLERQGYISCTISGVIVSDLKITYLTTAVLHPIGYKEPKGKKDKETKKKKGKSYK